LKPKPCTHPVPLATLLAYWLEELDEVQEDAVEAHLLGCAHCSASLQTLVDIADEIRAGVRSGEVRVVLADAFIDKLAAQNVRLREYRLEHNGSVNCTVAPEDEVLVTRLRAPLAGIERLDLDFLDANGQSMRRLQDIPFDPAAGEVVITQQIQAVRAMPAMTVRYRLYDTASPSGERLVSEYALHHTPHPS
jgi:Putative zinc-finger